MTELEKMEKGLIYNPSDFGLLKKQLLLAGKVKWYNKISPANFVHLMIKGKRIFGELGRRSLVIPPVFANWGGKHVFIGDDVYVNSGATFVDDANIYIGNHVMVGPNVTFATAGHPVLPEPRSKGLQYNVDIRIGNNVWIGAGAIILPGITIGENSVVGAGSVVTKDIPENVVAVGNPCRVLREINEHDKEFYYKDKRFEE